MLLNPSQPIVSNSFGAIMLSRTSRCAGDNARYFAFNGGIRSTTVPVMAGSLLFICSTMKAVQALFPRDEAVGGESARSFNCRTSAAFFFFANLSLAFSLTGFLLLGLALALARVVFLGRPALDRDFALVPDRRFAFAGAFLRFG